MDKQLLAVLDAPRFIDDDELEVLNDIKTRCYFGDIKERTAFIKKVCSSVGTTKFQLILEDDFEAAFNVAISILRERGDRILKGKGQSTNLAWGIYFNSKRGA